MFITESIIFITTKAKWLPVTNMCHICKFFPLFGLYHIHKLRQIHQENDKALTTLHCICSNTYLNKQTEYELMCRKRTTFNIQVMPRCQSKMWDEIHFHEPFQSLKMRSICCL